MRERTILACGDFGEKGEVKQGGGELKRLRNMLSHSIGCLYRGQPLETKPNPPAETFSDNYERYTAQMDKEDSLINNRINWLLAAHTFLFGAVGVSKGIAGEAIGQTIAFVIPILGLASALLIWISIIGAIRSFCRYRYMLHEVCCENHDPNHQYPQLHRDKSNIVLGFLAPIGVPLVLAWGWSWLLWLAN